MAEVDEIVKCDFCGKSEEEVLHLTSRGELVICDECVDYCIEQQAAEGVIPDLRPLEKHFLFKPHFLTENDIRGDLSLFEYESLTDDEQREALISLIADRIRKDDLMKLLAEALYERMHEILCRTLEESGFADEERVRQKVIDALGPKLNLRPPPEDPHF